MRFDRRPGDIFAIQDEIAVQVTQALELSLDREGAGAHDRTGHDEPEGLPRLPPGPRAAREQRRRSKSRRRSSTSSAAIGARPGVCRRVRQPGAGGALRRRIRGQGRSAGAIRARAGARTGARGEGLDARPGERRRLPAACTSCGVREPVRGRGGLSTRAGTEPELGGGLCGARGRAVRGPRRAATRRSRCSIARAGSTRSSRATTSTKSVFLFYERGDVAWSERVARKGAEAPSRYLPALSRLCALRISAMGQSANGIRYCEEALAIDPLLEDTRRVLIRAYVNLGDVQAARQLVGESFDEVSPRALPILLDQRRWVDAGEIAYASLVTRDVFAHNDGRSPRRPSACTPGPPATSTAPARCSRRCPASGGTQRASPYCARRARLFGTLRSPSPTSCSRADRSRRADDCSPR